MLIEADVGSVFGAIIGIIIIIGFIAVKINSLKLTTCPHCGHDSGIPRSRAAVCPACGRNRTVSNTRKAAKR